MQNLMLIRNITLKFENNKVLNARAMNFKIVSELPEHPLLEKQRSRLWNFSETNFC